MIKGGTAKEANKCYSRITEDLAEKRNEPYLVMMSWIRRKISFSMMKSIIMCILGSRSIKLERENMTGVEELASYKKARYNIIYQMQRHSQVFCFFDMNLVIFAVLFHIKRKKTSGMRRFL